MNSKKSAITFILFALAVVLMPNVKLPSFMANPAVFIPFIAVVTITLFIISRIQAKKRREAMQALAAKLGFTFSPDKNHSYASQFGCIDQMDKGLNRYAQNILSGVAPDGSHCHIFDYHYETKSSDSEGSTRTSHHYYSIFILMLPAHFPELKIKPEGLFSKIAQGIGFDDINFESLEFSKHYEVKSKDKKFAYDFCNAQMIDYLLKQPNYVIEVESNVLSLIFNGRLKVDEILPHFESLQAIRSHMPQYLFTN